jgi:hypothetical protein
MRSKRYRPVRLTSGVVLQSGQDIQERGAIKHAQITRGPFRGIVLNVYPQNSTSNLSGLGVECDVLLVSTYEILTHVRVLQPGGFGVNNAHPWVPKATGAAGQAALDLSGKVPGTFPKLSDLDGDMVLVDFIEGDPLMPIVIGAIQHESSNRKVRSSIAGQEANPIDPDPNAATAALYGGWSEDDGGSTRGVAYDEEYYVHHRGTEVRVNRQGDVLIDTVGAYGADDTESATLTAFGQVRVRIKNLQKFTVECDGEDVLEVHKDLLGVTHVDLGEGATERIVLGDKLTTWLLAHVHPTAMGPSGPPVPVSGGVNLAGPLPDHLSAQHRVK